MLPNPDPIPGETLRSLHRRSLDEPAEIRRLLEQVRRAGVALTAGINRKSATRVARILAIERGRLRLETEEVSARVGRQLALNFQIDGCQYFFVSRVLEAAADGLVEVDLPIAIYLTENRELFRSPVAEVARAPRRVEVRAANGPAVIGEVADWTYHGLGVDVPTPAAKRLGDRVRLRYLDGPDAGSESYGSVRHYAPEGRRNGWVRIGLSVSRVSAGPLIPIERHQVIPIDAQPAPDSSVPDRAPAETRLVEFGNDRGETLRAYIDCWGDPTDATAVVITPAWGRTKETLLPLAATIVESFRSAGQPIAVMRFDGTRRRGESYLPAECRGEGLEHLRFTFSQAARDTQAAIRFLREADAYRCSKVVLVTFSLSAVEGRRVVADDSGRDLAGWISAVGIADLQSALHVISGGVDYGYGLLRGLRFGLQELFGVLVDIDHSGLDAVQNGLSFLEDARRDMAEIRVPITWLHGRFDAWVDPQRVRSLLSCGETSGRRLLELPIGHQLRSSSEALATFRLIASEVARMSLGHAIETRQPDLEILAKRIQGERQRLPHTESGLKSFWREYLLGRDERLGIEILTATDTYRDFMIEQTALLELKEGQRIADLGSGTGDFFVQLAEDLETPSGLRVHAIDFVPDALARGIFRIRNHRPNGKIRVSALAADLDLSRAGRSIPLASTCFDAVLASLLLSYVDDPRSLLHEIRRILKPNGILVLSTLRRDADISKIYADSLAERYSDRPLRLFGSDGASKVDRSLPQFLNHASRIVQLEDRGRFRFFALDELRELGEACGFTDLRFAKGLGDPPQALLLKGRRP